MKPTHTHCIFDMDGVLLDTERLYTEVAVALLSTYGKTFTLDLKQKIMGRPAQQAAAFLIDHFKLPLEPEDFLSQRNDHLEALLATCQPMPGAPELVRRLHQLGVPQAVATGSSDAWLAIKKQNHEAWFVHFESIVTSDHPDLKRGKPHPDVFLLAAQHMDADPACCLAFEDSHSGLRAAKAAGMTTIYVPDPHTAMSDVPQEADHVLPSLRSFEPSAWIAAHVLLPGENA